MISAVVFLTALALRGSVGEDAQPQENVSHLSWTWECKNDTCTKLLHNDLSGEPRKSFDVCRLTCSPGVLWPKPTGKESISKTIIPINVNAVFEKTKFPNGDSNANSLLKGLVEQAGKRFINKLSAKVKKGAVRVLGRNPSVTLEIKDPSVVTFEQHAKESYTIDVTSNPGEVNVKISAETFLGARHGLETFSQLIIYDTVSQALVMPSEVKIVDDPKYTYRGILLDTARNFISVNAIKKVIEAMAMNKLNTFHWHITDSHSFPFQSKSYPQLTKLGAYTPKKVYTEDDIIDLVEFARIRGVRILPEFDAPAHVGEGWQWAGDATVCFNKQPWTQYCVEPPCGQLNPTSEKMYSILGGIYKDMEALFDSDLFHMGGDEVNINCWNTTDIVVEAMKERGLGRTDDDFHQLWADFQARATKIHEEMAGKSKKLVLWTSTLTETGKVDKYLDNKKYIIQIWTLGRDKVIAELVNKGFEVIFSNYDALYFDCGFGAWVGTGNNWCSPYIPWQKVYNNDPEKLLEAQGVNGTEAKKLILGSEATLWTEQADDQSVENRLWPRAAAMAEQLWSNGGKWEDAEHRFLFHRQRMVENGLNPDTLQPEWCLQNPGNCYL